MTNYSHQKIKGEEITLLDDVVNRLAHDLILDNCRIVFKASPKALIVTQVHFLNCILEFKKKLSNYPFTTCFFEGCSFFGKLESCEFGNRQRIHEPSIGKITAGIANCDFSGCDFLNGIRFIDCNVDSIKFPKCPHFVILSPLKNCHYLANEDLPEKLKIKFDFRGWLTETDNAIVYNADFIASKYGVPIERQQEIFRKYDFILM